MDFLDGLGKTFGLTESLLGTSGSTRGSSTGSREVTESSTGSETNKLFDEEALGKLLAQLMDSGEEFTPEAGEEQAALAGKLAIDDIMKQYLPGLQSGAAMSGMYESTVSDSMQNELAVRAMEGSQQAQTQAKLGYADMFAKLAQLSASTAGKTTGTEYDKNASTKETSTSTNTTRNKSDGLFSGLFG